MLVFFQYSHATVPLVLWFNPLIFLLLTGMGFNRVTSVKPAFQFINERASRILLKIGMRLLGTKNPSKLIEGLFRVGMARFELATSWSQTRRDNRATLHPER